MVYWRPHGLSLRLRYAGVVEIVVAAFGARQRQIRQDVATPDDLSHREIRLGCQRMREQFQPCRPGPWALDGDIGDLCAERLADARLPPCVRAVVGPEDIQH